MKTIFYRARDIPLLFFIFKAIPKNNNLILKGNPK